MKEVPPPVYALHHKAEPRPGFLDQDVVVQRVAQADQAVQPVAALLDRPAGSVRLGAGAWMGTPFQPSPNVGCHSSKCPVIPSRAASAISRNQPRGSTAPGGSGMNAGFTSGSAMRTHGSATASVAAPATQDMPAKRMQSRKEVPVSKRFIAIVLIPRSFYRGKCLYPAEDSSWPRRPVYDRSVRMSTRPAALETSGKLKTEH